ncbi:MAG: hypothetical protein SNJ76_04745 [Fimbriimonadaceae bacterium]
MKTRKRLGEILIEEGYLTSSQLQRALAWGHRPGERFGDFLVRISLVTERQVCLALARQFGYPVSNVKWLRPQIEAVALVDGEFALAHRILPVKTVGGALEVVLADPLDTFATDWLRQKTGLRLVPRIAPASDVERAVRRAYGYQSPNRPAAAKGRRGRCNPDDRKRLLEIVDAQNAAPASDPAMSGDATPNDRGRAA